MYFVTIMSNNLPTSTSGLKRKFSENMKTADKHEKTILMEIPPATRTVSTSTSNSIITTSPSYTETRVVTPTRLNYFMMARINVR